jgi:hypothetical protein
MTISLEDFLTRTGAEVAGGRIILGIQGDRRTIGSIEPAFTLNEEGQQVMDELNDGVEPAVAIADAKAKTKRTKTVVHAAPGVDPATTAPAVAAAAAAVVAAQAALAAEQAASAAAAAPAPAVAPATTETPAA